MDPNQFMGVAILLYALSNPVGIIPIFMNISNKLSNSKKSYIIIVAAITVAIFLNVSALFGKNILSFFDVDLDDFRIAGGLLALFIAFEMFQAKYGGIIQTQEEQSEAQDTVHSIAITPLAFPLLVGPAEMSVMITFSNDIAELKSRVLLAASSIITSLMIALTLFMAIPIHKLIGKTGINVATRTMALIVAAIGVKFITTGVHNKFI